MIFSKKFNPILVTILIATLTFPIFAQDKNQKVFDSINKLSKSLSLESESELKYTINKRGGVNFLSGKLSQPISKANLQSSAMNFLKTNKGIFKFRDVDEELKFETSKSDQFGLTHAKFKQVYNGIPVLGREINVHLNKNNEIHAVTGNFVPEIQLASISPSFSGLDAIAHIKETNNLGMGKALIEKAELVVYHNEATNIDHLAYLVTIAAGPKFDNDIVIDATSGEVLRTYTNIHENSVNGSGTDALGNTVNPLHVYQGSGFPTSGSSVLSQARGNTGNYNMVNVVHTGLGNIYGMDGNHDDLIAGQYWDFSQVDYIHNSTSTFSSTDQVHKAGVSGAVGFEETLLYFKNEHNRNGIDDAGMPVIHIQDWYDSSNPINAFWSGSLGFMAFSLGGTYGSTTYRPLSAAMDVVAHELTHGITDRTSGLVYENHPGALNEALSDIFGYLVEAYASGDYTDWLMGEDIYESGGAGAFRSMSDPPAFGDPDKVGHANYIAPVANPNSSNDYGGVHTNSGIPNKVFYLLVEGGTHYGVTVNAFHSTRSTSAGLAADLFYLANTGGYFTTTTTFDQARTLMESACQALFPGDSTKLRSVQNAWYSVNVGSQPGGGGGTYATLPYSTGFESGLDQYWTTSSSSSTYGRIQVTSSNGPHSGSNHLTMDVNTSGNYNTNEAWLYLDLSGETQVELDFWWKEFGDETHTSDGVYFSDNGGSSFVKVQNLNGGSYTNNTWQNFTLDLDQLAAANSLSLTSTFVVKFQQYDNYVISTDGHAIDDISVTASGGGGGTAITSESESNDSYTLADGPVGQGTNVSGSISSSSDDDWFYFDVSSAGNINISVSHEGGADLDWWLYKDPDLTNYVVRGYTTNNPEANSYNASTGRYYLRIDGYLGSTSSYTLTITGGLAQVTSVIEKDDIIEEKEGITETIPEVFSLAQNFPNPFNPTTEIRYSIITEGAVSLKIYNIMGEEVANLVDRHHEAGTFQVNFDASMLSSGIYIYQLVSKDGILIKKMSLLK